MSDDIVEGQRIPGVSDRGARRYRIFSFDFDSRAMDLQDSPEEGWSEEAREQWQRRREQLVAGLAAEYVATTSTGRSRISRLSGRSLSRSWPTTM